MGSAAREAGAQQEKRSVILAKDLVQDMSRVNESEPEIKPSDGT